MKLLFDFLPIVLFFVAYKFYGVFVATATAMFASLVQVVIHRYRHRHFESMHVITLILVSLLGAATLFSHNALYIKWKPTAMYWAFSLLFLGSHWVGKKTLTERMMGAAITLPALIWSRLNRSWVVFFLIMGGANLYVVYHFSTDVWVNFKLFGSLLLTGLFAGAQALYMARYVEGRSTQDSNESNIT